MQGHISKDNTIRAIWRSIKRDKYLLVLISPVVVYYIIFHYVPMYGALIAFKDYNPGIGFYNSPWVGFKWFKQFFESFYFWRLIRNAILLNIYGIIFGFPIPIIFALLLNEVSDGFFKRSIQTISYLPHFISLVVVVGMMVNFLSPVDGIVNMFLKSIGKEPINFMGDPRWFRFLYISSGIWQEFGWSSIIYLAALSAIDPTLYDAAKVDGANRWQQMLNITLPDIMPTIIILLILNVGHLLSVGFEKIILMYQPMTYEVADVISTYVYRRGVLGADYSFAAAVGLFNSIINFMLLVTFNRISKRLTEISLW
jgi:putative aldouronate transport system permease protein